MPRQISLGHRRPMEADFKYNDRAVAEFIACLMKEGKRSTAERIMYGAIDLVEKKAGQPAGLAARPIRSRPKFGRTVGLRSLSAGSSVIPRTVAKSPCLKNSRLSSWPPRTMKAHPLRRRRIPIRWLRPTRPLLTSSGRLALRGRGFLFLQFTS
jgi:hypothetical protein